MLGLFGRGGITGGLHPPGAAAIVNGMYFEAEFGIPGVKAVGAGHDKQRGPFVHVIRGVKLDVIPHGDVLGFQANGFVRVYNPRLEPSYGACDRSPRRCRTCPFG
jgi:hypothetical protein